MKKYLAIAAIAFSSLTACAQSTNFVSYNSAPAINITQAAPGAGLKMLSSYPSFMEFSRSGSSEKGSIGALGSFEMNMSYNMDYTTGWHKFYDSSKNAYWLALNAAGLYLQYAPAGTGGNDIWDTSGNQYAFYFAIDAAKFNGTVQPFKSGTSDLGTVGATFRRVYVDSTTAQTAGSVTINKASGRVFFPAGQRVLTLTDSYCTPNAHVFANVATQDVSAIVAQVTPVSGSCQITLNAAPAGQVGVDFFIVSVE